MSAATTVTWGPRPAPFPPNSSSIAVGESGFRHILSRALSRAMSASAEYTTCLSAGGACRVTAPSASLPRDLERAPRDRLIRACVDGQDLEPVAAGREALHELARERHLGGRRGKGHLERIHDDLISDDVDPLVRESRRRARNGLPADDDGVLAHLGGHDGSGRNRMREGRRGRETISVRRRADEGVSAFRKERQELVE